MLQVIRDRKWKEVVLAFSFPTTITSASFVLRKYYLSLLYHFEQVYYFHKQVPSISMPGSTYDSGLSNYVISRFYCKLGIYFDGYILADPVSRNVVNGSAALAEGATRDEFPGQPSDQFVVFG